LLYCTVDYDFVSSDHKPLFVCLDDFLPMTNMMPHITNTADFNCHFITDWSKSTDHCVTSYQYELDKALSQIRIPGLSTGLCTSVLKQTVDYYINRNSHVFSCFVDFRQAFDNVDYWKLFLKLLNDGVNGLIVRLLAARYCNQICCVRWRSTFRFRMSNGTRQGGVWSPYLFTRYMREMLGAIVDSGIGSSIGGMLINVFAYADDLVLLESTSVYP